MMPEGKNNFGNFENLYMYANYGSYSNFIYLHVGPYM